MNALSRNVLIATCLVLFFAGCKRSGSHETEQSEAKQKSSVEVLASLHWYGNVWKQGDTNLNLLKSLLAKSESLAVTDQFMDKLALAPWTFDAGKTNIQLLTNYSAAVKGDSRVARLRSFLGDLAGEEFRFDMGQRLNKEPQFRFAVRPLGGTTEIWSNKLSGVLEILCENRLTSNETGARISIARNSRMASMLGKAFNELRLEQSGSWWVVAGGDPETTLEVRETESTNSLMVAYLNLDKFLPLVGVDTDILGAKSCEVTVSGEAGNVKVSSRLIFANSLPSEFGAWKVPTNMIRDPLVSFTAVRRPWFVSSKLTNILATVGLPKPDQLYVWAREGVPLQTYFAVGPVQSSNEIIRFASKQLTNVNLWMTTNSVGQLKFSPASLSLAWQNAPFMKPFVQAGVTPYEDFVVGGIFVPIGTNPPPYTVFEQLKENTGLVYYDWELTGPRAEQWIDISQLFRIAFLRPQIRADAPSLLWIKALAPQLGNTVTTVQVVGNNELQIIRKGPIGVTGAELHLLIDWLENPAFPLGLHSTELPRLEMGNPGHRRNLRMPPAPGD